MSNSFECPLPSGSPAVIGGLHPAVIAGSTDESITLTRGAAMVTAGSVGALHNRYDVIIGVVPFHACWPRRESPRGERRTSERRTRGQRASERRARHGRESPGGPLAPLAGMVSFPGQAGAPRGAHLRAAA